MCLINKDWACEKTFNQVQPHKWIWHSLNINLCEVYGYQKWDSPKSNMKFQWSIQSRHTKIELGRVTYLNYRNMHIWPLTKLDNITLKLFIWLYIHHIIWFFWIKTSHCEIDAWNFWYFNLMNKSLDFRHHTFSYKSLSLFPSRILVCATIFIAHYLFSFWDLHWLSSLSKNNKIKEWEDI